MNWTFAQPWFLLLLLVLAGMLVWYAWIYPARRLRIALSYPPEKAGASSTLAPLLRWMPIITRYLSIACWIIALARPQSAGELLIREEEGIDLMLLFDTSASMEAEDFQPNRLEAAKTVTRDFIQGRPQDRIGLIVFAEDAFTYAPLTLDHDLLDGLLLNLKTGILPKEGTALGSAIAAGINRLADTKSPSRVLIVITDGASNRGKLDPLTASRLAAARGIRIYTIGVGEESSSDSNGQTNLDLTTLREIATITGGQFFRASDPNALTSVFQEIDLLERNPLAGENDRRVEDRYPFFIKAGLILFAFSLLFQFLSWYNPLEE